MKTNKTKKIVITIILLLFAGFLAYQHLSDKSVIGTTHYSVMGGIILEVKLYGNPEDIDKVSSEIYKAVAEVDSTCNIYNPESELSRLNATAYDKPFKCSDLLWELLMESKKWYDTSNGAFDISATPLMKLWGFYRKRKTLPSEKELAEAKKAVGLDKVVFNNEEKTVKFTVPGMRLDMGGIAKGFAVERGAEVAGKMGVDTGLINLSGNAICLPKPFPGKKKYIIGVKNPLLKNTLCGKIELLGQSIATSGDYERYVVIDGKHYAHIMDPRTGKPVENVYAVTVITPSATVADALSTTVFVNGQHFAEMIHDQFPSTEILIIRKNDKGEPEMIKIGDSWEECNL